MLGTSKTYLEWFQQNGDPSGERVFFGVIPAYPVFMFIGVAVTIIIAAIRFKQKGVPLRELELAIFITIPLGILGASIFGKAFIPHMVWYKAFFFWEPGMSLFGCLLLGMSSGFGWFYIRSKKTQISMWVYADCIIPHILIGQAIGRWGNLFNHEILGDPIAYEQLGWLPEAIKNKLFYFPNLTDFNLVGDWWNNIDSFSGLRDFLNKPIQYHQPIFLYESIANLGLWVVIVFGVDNLGRIFSKPKPWDLQPKAYPGWYNRQCKSLQEKDLIDVQTQLPIRYKNIKIKTESGESLELKLGFFQAWNKAYYWYVPDSVQSKDIEDRETEWRNSVDQGLKKLNKIKVDHQIKIKKTNENYENKMRSLDKNHQKYQQLLNEKKTNIQSEKNKYLNQKQEITNVIGTWSRKIKGNPLSKELATLHNPNKYFVIYSGVLTGCYVVGYLLIRIILETQRRPEELFIQNSLVVDFIILSLILVGGIIIILLAQFVAPYRYREVHWLYEKSY
ncbi:prolipoprotein diacylglyceryl transferase family protein [Williamsoniiplasma luminosum]|uniref:Diacylglyceryl transferase n=1 Tax=Williamsoniiplasma luminosum TaxID=214888 RepID=A0A2S0NKD6_9MOLU|nr:prolipoprotein diacylglyceryl transferase family protein [Williamsoniiplasma luminosum]AVP49477.1 MAG: diacylglyceryl transferase [Williamsoniiplasma luminosum]